MYTQYIELIRAKFSFFILFFLDSFTFYHKALAIICKSLLNVKQKREIKNTHLVYKYKRQLRINLKREKKKNEEIKGNGIKGHVQNYYI